MIGEPDVVSGDEELKARGVHFCCIDPDEHRRPSSLGHIKHELAVGGHVNVVPAPLL